MEDAFINTDSQGCADALDGLFVTVFIRLLKLCPDLQQFKNDVRCPFILPIFQDTEVLFFFNGMCVLMEGQYTLARIQGNINSRLLLSTDNDTTKNL